MSNSVLIVNPLVSITYLIDRLKSYDIDIYILFTDKNSYEFASNKINFKNISSILYIKNIEAAIKFYCELDIKYVINGSDLENTVIFDKITSRLTPQYSNDINTSLLRVDKFKLHKFLCDNKFRYIKQEIITTKQDIIKSNIKYPFIIKPALSIGGSVGTVKITSRADLDQFFDSRNVASIDTRSENRHADLLVCEYITGKEYIFDTFSVDGRHYSSGVHYYEKIYIDGKPSIKSINFLKDTDLTQKICDYAYMILSAVNFNNGFAHIEIFEDDLGFVVNEINPRISGCGGLVNESAKLNGMPTQIELLVKSIFNKLIKSPNLFGKYTKIVTLRNPKGNVIPEFNSVISNENIKSLLSIVQIIPAGRVDNNCYVASVLLGSNSKKEIENDANRLFEYDLNRSSL